MTPLLHSKPWKAYLKPIQNGKQAFAHSYMLKKWKLIFFRPPPRRKETWFDCLSTSHFNNYTPQLNTAIFYLTILLTNFPNQVQNKHL